MESDLNLTAPVCTDSLLTAVGVTAPTVGGSKYACSSVMVLLSKNVDLVLLRQYIIFIPFNASY
jgi:hypothetical protein